MQVSFQELLRVGVQLVHEGRYEAGIGRRQLSEGLGEVHLGFGDAREGVFGLLAGEDELRVGRLVARSVLDLDEVLVVRRRLVFGQLEEADQSLKL